MAGAKCFPWLTILLENSCKAVSRVRELFGTGQTESFKMPGLNVGPGMGVNDDGK